MPVNKSEDKKHKFCTSIVLDFKCYKSDRCKLSIDYVKLSFGNFKLQSDLKSCP